MKKITIKEQKQKQSNTPTKRKEKRNINKMRNNKRMIQTFITYIFNLMSHIKKEKKHRTGKRQATQRNKLKGTDINTYKIKDH